MDENLDFLGNLDPDDPRQASQQIANKIRAAILTRKIGPGERLPSQTDLAARYGVARETIKRALDTLRTERLIVSRQGSGVFVRAKSERPVGLRPHIDRAFSEPHVSIDFAGFSGETLHGTLQEPLDKVRVGQYTPESVHIRALILDTEIPWSFPCAVDTLADDPDFRKRMRRLSLRHSQAVIDSVQELEEMDLVPTVSAEVRVHSLTPLFKLYIINKQEAFYGFYPVTEFSFKFEGQQHSVFNLMGKDQTLFQFASSEDEDSMESEYVAAAQDWFDSLWNTVSRELPA